MKKQLLIILFSAGIMINNPAYTENEHRIQVELPPQMKKHLLKNMRAHLVTIDRILLLMSEEKFDLASDITESELGMSSLTKHGGNHMAKFYPQGMRQAGTQLHKRASQLSRKLQEGELLPSLQALQKVTAACNACHAGYKIK